MNVILLLSRDTLGEERDELVRRGAPFSYKTWDQVTAPLDRYPVVVRWMMAIQDMTFQLSFMEELERCATRVINPPRAVQTCDKASIFFLWNRHLKDRIPMPPTIMTSSGTHAREFIVQHGKAVVKPVDGQAGNGIAILDSKDSRGLSKLSDRPGTLFMQKFIPSTHEIRTIVVGEEVIAQYARYNLGGLHSLGAGAILLPVSDSRVGLPASTAADLREIAIAAKGMTGLDLLALDALIDAKQQPWLIDINPFFAYGQTKELGFAIASRIADFVMALSQ